MKFLYEKFISCENDLFPKILGSQTHIYLYKCQKQDICCKIEQ